MSVVHISTMSGKLKGIPSINTNTLTNKFCQKMFNSTKENLICKSCYSYEMLQTFRKNCIPKFEQNSKVLSEAIIPNLYLPKINASFFRFSAHGELINKNHLINLMNLTLKNPHTTFTLWTKKKGLVISYCKKYGKPDNLILIYSNEIIGSIAKLPEYFDKTFNNILKKDSSVNCFQKCIDCLLCYTKNDTETIIEVKK